MVYINAINYKPKTILVIGDAHAKSLWDTKEDDKGNVYNRKLVPYDESNKRFDLAGALIVDKRPDVVVDIGDFCDNLALCSHESGKSAASKREVRFDLAASQDARERVTKPLRELQEKQRFQKHKLYKPRLIALEGNHEYRGTREIDASKKFNQLFPHQDPSKAQEWGWEYHPYVGSSPAIVPVEGILFAHYMTSGTMGRAIGGDYLARRLILKHHMSCVVGHDHRLRYHQERTKHRDLIGLSVGCFFTEFENYAGQSNDEWWPGLCLLHLQEPGSFDLETVNIKRLEAMYG